MARHESPSVLRSRVDRRFSSVLLAWFDHQHRPLPWRKNRHPYRRWVAEVMLQQTRVAQAGPVYERFIQRFPTVRSLARASPDEVLKVWEGAGYYARARNLRAAALVLTASGPVRWPRSSQAWEQLPGVGPYTARALASLTRGEPVVALESNGLRVAARWTLERGDPASNATRRRLEAHLATWLPLDRPGEFNEAIMELGETVCRPVGPRCSECPVRDGCRAREELADPSSIPTRVRKGPRPRVRAAIAAILRDGRWLVHRRPPRGLLGGLWELPGGKLEPNEPPEAAIRREVREETGLRLADLSRAGSVRHDYSHFSVSLDVFRGKAIGRFRAEEPTDSFRWVTPGEFELLPRPLATIRAARLIGRMTADDGARALPATQARRRVASDRRVPRPT
ncbi:MAG: NUDIX domain-containing protein [Thermoplasmata archaeon]|nr:NUDIX domain-containing protein [Thermoplasmata archaeon]MCI4359581.1 NUDIX domain-containing protein [Thermoplasmata archaeon]